ncbi:MAG: hypothetical protein ACRD6U_11650 [Nitrososphaeraceae archaeon]
MFLQGCVINNKDQLSIAMSKFLRYLLGSTNIIIVVGFLVVLLHIVDMSAGDTWALNINDRNSFQYTIIYCLITVASLIIQTFLLMVSVRISFKTKKATSPLSGITRYLYVGSHIAVMSSVAYLLLEQIVTSRYHTVLLELIVGLSLIPSVFILISLAFTSLKSFSSTKRKIVMIYSIAIIAIVVQLIIAFCYIEVNLYSKPEIITPDRNPWASYFYTNLQSTMSLIYEVSESISFIIIWISLILLTKQYAQKMGKIKYSITLSIPMIYFLLQYSPLLLEQIGTLSSLLMAEGSLFLYFYNFVLNTVNIGTGILFGTSFYILARSLVYDDLKYYLIICGTGIMIIFSSGVSTIVTLTPFPAWAIVSLSFILPASFLFLIGIDSATYYIASDTLIRRYLYRHRDQFELFQALGYTKASDIVELKIHKQLDNLKDKTFFKPLSELEDTKEYIEKVIVEMKQSNTKMGNSK